MLHGYGRVLPACPTCAVSHCSAAVLFLNDTCGLVNATGCLPSPHCHQAISCPGENQGDAEVEGPHLQLVSAAVGRAARARHVHPA